MKFAIRLLLISALAIGPVGCNRSNAPDQSVSANADKIERSNEPQPNSAVNEPTPEPARKAARETRPTYRAPEKQTRRPLEVLHAAYARFTRYVRH